MLCVFFMIYRIPCTTSLFIKRFFKLVRILLNRPMMRSSLGMGKVSLMSKFWIYSLARIYSRAED